MLWNPHVLNKTGSVQETKFEDLYQKKYEDPGDSFGYNDRSVTRRGLQDTLVIEILGIYNVMDRK